MKKIVLIMIFVMLFSVGCSSGTDQPDTSNADVSEDSEETKSEETEIQKKEDTGIQVEGKYFTLTLPESWKDKYYENEIENEYGYYMEFIEKTSSDTQYGGWLFSIAIPDEATFDEPSYNYIGQINIDGKEKTMIVVWPTDVQFSEETAEAYQLLAETSEDVITSVEPNEGITLTMTDDLFEMYIFPGSDMRYITESELKYMDAETLRFGRNEIYAKHGLIFKSEDLREHFESFDWYKGTVDDAEKIELNEYEKANIELIRKMEEKLK